MKKINFTILYLTFLGINKIYCQNEQPMDFIYVELCQSYGCNYDVNGVLTSPTSNHYCVQNTHPSKTIGFWFSQSGELTTIENFKVVEREDAPAGSGDYIQIVGPGKSLDLGCITIESKFQGGFNRTRYTRPVILRAVFRN